MVNDVQIHRKELEIKARKKDILEEAAKLFSEKGYHEVKVDEIAEKVGLSKGTIYLYFENKEAIFYSIIIEKTDLLESQLDSAIQIQQPFIQSLERFIYTFLTFFKENESFFKITHSEKIHLSDEGHDRVKEYGMKAFQKYFQLMVKLIKLGQKEKLIRKRDPDVFGKTLRGLLNSFTFHRIFWGSPYSTEEETNQIVDIFLHGAGKQNNDK
ncbi:TetR/AcrR family transcriptional regulator [bacterium]|nr:TetR/AcrR family transcriptional regulator [bacterium]